jgi:exodeoxyribonuclease VII large subunit
MITGTSEAGDTRRRSNASVSLHAYLKGMDQAIRRLPAEWVRCELHSIKVGDKFTRMEFIELDAKGKQVARTGGGCFPSTWRSIEQAFQDAGLSLQEGSQVLVRMQAEINPAYGLNISVLDVDVTFALGDLNTRIQAIRRRMREAGHWDLNRRLPRPADFLRVAVISPSGAAGLGDFRSTADRLMDLGLVHFDYHEAPFQTRDAPARIVEILRGIYRRHAVDDERVCAVAIIRGGGASADLAWLIDEKLTEAVCRMNMPVITGIGHERDRNLLDEVAFIACDTPSKVAEHISRTVTQAALSGERAYGAILAQAMHDADRASAALTAAMHQVERDAREDLRVAGDLVAANETALRPGARALLDAATTNIVAAGARVLGGARRTREDANESVSAMRHQVQTSAGETLQVAELGRSRAHHEALTRMEGLPRTALDDTTRLMDEITLGAVRLADQVGSIVEETAQRVKDGAVDTLDAASSAIALISERSSALDPVSVLAAGYAILRDRDGMPLVGRDAVRSAGSVRAQMRDGDVGLAVDDDAASADEHEHVHHDMDKER